MMKQLRGISIACILMNLLCCIVDCYQEDTFVKHGTIFPKSSKDSKAKSTKVIKSKASKYSKGKGGEEEEVHEDEYDTTTTTDLNEPTVSASTPTITVQSTTSTDLSHTNDTDTSDTDNTTTISSCTHDVQILTIPTNLVGQSLANITPMETSEAVPSMFDDCNYREYPTRFNFPNPRLVWYDISIPDNDKQRNTACLCTTLRSMENAFIIAVLSTATDTDTCDGMTCISESDFTSESIVWRIAEGRKYKVAVSVLPGGLPTGTYDLTVIDIGSDACPEEVGSSVYLPGDCTDNMNM